MTMDDIKITAMGEYSIEGTIDWFWKKAEDNSVTPCARMEVVTELMNKIKFAEELGVRLDIYTYDFRWIHTTWNDDNICHFLETNGNDYMLYHICVQDHTIHLSTMEYEEAEKEERKYKIVEYRIKQERFCTVTMVMPTDAEEYDFEDEAIHKAEEWESEMDWDYNDYWTCDGDWDVGDDNLTADEARDYSTANDVEDFE